MRSVGGRAVAAVRADEEVRHSGHSRKGSTAARECAVDVGPASEQAGGVRSGGSRPRCAEARRGRAAPARRALEEAALEQIRLVDVLDRVRLLADRDRERREPDRAAAEALADRAAGSRGRGGRGPRGRPRAGRAPRPAAPASIAPVAAHLGVVAHALEQPVGDARRAAARARRSRARPPSSICDVEDARRAARRSRARSSGLVVVEPVLDAEAVAQRRRQQARRAWSRRSA